MQIIKIGSNFWNIRGSFKVGGVVDIGTHCSLVKCSDGKFVFLDACELPSKVRAKINQLTHGGKLVKAIINLHPFHTVHVTKMHEIFPHAALYGTQRHRTKLPDLPWAKLCTDDLAFHKKFAADFEFSVPRGVDFISSNEKVHFSSVLVFHKASKTIHVDDTIMFSNLPGALRSVGLKTSFGFHPTLVLALQKEAGAADKFERWANNLIRQWGSAENLCAAHTTVLLASENQGESIKNRLQKALKKVRWILLAHRVRYGR